MQNFFLLLVFMATLFISCNNPNSQQNNQQPDVAVGGYHVRKVEDVSDAAKKAAELIQKKYSGYQWQKTVQAASQVVAGTNYRFVMEFQTPDGIKTLEIEVYQDLQNNMELTSDKELK